MGLPVGEQEEKPEDVIVENGIYFINKTFYLFNPNNILKFPIYFRRYGRR